MKSQISIIKSLAMVMTLAVILVATEGQAAAQTHESILFRHSAF